MAKQKKEKIQYPETIRNVPLNTWTDYTLDEFMAFVTKAHDEVQHAFRGTHKNITFRVGYDYSTCYYEGDTPDLVLEFNGTRAEGGKKRN